MSQRGRIDVHHHYVPPAFAEAAKDITEWPVPQWTVEIDQDFNSSCNIGTAILSLTTPGPSFGKDVQEVAHIARESNNFGAQIRKTNPKSYGFFASIPSPIDDSQGVVDEIARAFDELQADGVTIMSQYDGYYLGNEKFAPMWEVLNQRHAVVFMHPTSPPNFQPSNPAMLAPLLDFALETTKTAMDMIVQGIPKQYPNVKIILSHAGGALPYLWERTSILLPGLGAGDMTYDEIKEGAESFYFDIALSGNPHVIDLLTKFAKPGHVLFGSDFPYAHAADSKQFTARYESADITSDLRKSIDYEAGLELFPRLKESL